MSMNENAVGILRLLAVPEGCEDRVINFLGRFYKGRTREQIAELIAGLPITLSRKVPKAVGQKVLAELNALGATGQFVFPQVATGTENPEKKEIPGRQAGETGKKEESSLEDTLNGAFRQENLRFPVPLFYRLGLSVVLFAMVLLPLIYVAMVAGVGYLVYRHATVDLHLFHTVRNAKAALIAYAGPLIIGVLLFFFMIKPLFARRHETWKEVEMSPKAEPLLSDFIGRVCRSVGAPMPTLIRFDNQVNASASFRRGLASFFGNDLVLTIGLPLAGGLSLSEFAGVLAHEFGHFAQASGMRLTYLVRSINYWFARVVYEEDEWDFRLRQWSREIDLRIGIILYLARFFIWVTRKVLWVLMHAGHVISCFMLRQMEYDADRYEAGLVGAEVFSATSRKLPLLSVAHARAFEEINEAWKEGKLPDNLTAMVRFKSEQMEEKIRQDILERQASLRTGFFDTHPADSDRIASAGKVAGTSLFCWPREEVPDATVLFKDFDTLARRVTIEHYRLSLGKAPDQKNLLDVEAMAKARSVERHFSDHLVRYFLKRFTPWRTLGLDDSFPLAPFDPKAALERLKSVRQQIVRAADDHDAALKQYFDLKDRRVQAGQAHSLLEAGFRIKGQDFSLPTGTREGVDAAMARYENRAAETNRVLRGFEDLHRERLQLALGLLQVPAVKERLDGNGPLGEKAASYWIALAVLQKQLPAFDKMNLDLSRLDILARQLEGHGQDEKLIEALRWTIEDLRSALEEIGQKLAAVPYPFEHSREGLTVGSYLVRSVPDMDDLGACYDIAGEAIRNAEDLITRLAGRLAETAGTVEQALSLPDLSA